MTRKTGIVYERTKLTEGDCFEIGEFWHPVIDGWNPLYKDILEPFNFMKYTCPRPPISMGKFNMDAAKKCPNVLRVPIKWSGSNEIRLPSELTPLREEIERVLQYDRFITGEIWTDFFVHITVHNSEVKAGQTQRFGGFHGDGLQGGKFKNKLICEHSYIATDPYPTVFALKPFFVGHVNEDRYNIFKEFDRQIDERTPMYSGRSEHLYLIDPYMVHASPEMPRDTSRTFIRITATPAELLMPKNTINPMFKGQQYPARIDVREFVADPDQCIPFDFYGLEEI